MSQTPSSPSPQLSQILTILSSYRHISPKIPDRFSEYLPELSHLITSTIQKQEVLRFIIPSFPFKVPLQGTEKKSLGALPDKGEEFALQLLDGFAASIAEVYEGGAKVVVVSDASAYGGLRTFPHVHCSERKLTSPDLLNISDAEAFAYFQGLRKIVASLGLANVEIVRAGTLAGTAPPAPPDLEEFSANIRETRKILDAQTIDPSNNENVKVTGAHFEKTLPKTDDPDKFQASMIRRGKVCRTPFPCKLISFINFPY